MELRRHVRSQMSLGTREMLGSLFGCSTFHRYSRNLSALIKLHADDVLSDVLRQCEIESLQPIISTPVFSKFE